MNPSIPQIGRCIGCDRPNRLDDGVCGACLARRGRKCAEMSNRCRTDPELAASVYDRIQTDRGRAMFLEMYGRVALDGRGATVGEVSPRPSTAIVWGAELTIPPPRWSARERSNI